MAEADRRPLEAGRLDVAQPCSIAEAHKLCMESVVLGRSSTTSSFTSATKVGAARINLVRRIPLVMANLSFGAFWVSQEIVHVDWVRNFLPTDCDAFECGVANG